MTHLFRAKQFRVAVVADSNLWTAKQVAEDFGVPAAFDSLEKMISRKAIDGLIAALPPEQRIVI